MRKAIGILGFAILIIGFISLVIGFVEYQMYTTTVSAFNNGLSSMNNTLRNETITAYHIGMDGLIWGGILITIGLVLVLVSFKTNFLGKKRVKL